MLQSLIRDLEEANAKFQEQLQNAIVPKFKIGDEIYYIRSWNKDIIKAKVGNINIYLNEYDSNFEYGLCGWCEADKIYYSFISDFKDEKLVFATKAEAQKYLEASK